MPLVAERGRCGSISSTSTSSSSSSVSIRGKGATTTAASTTRRHHHSRLATRENLQQQQPKDYHYHHPKDDEQRQEDQLDAIMAKTLPYLTSNTSITTAETQTSRSHYSSSYKNVRHNSLLFEDSQQQQQQQQPGLFHGTTDNHSHHGGGMSTSSLSTIASSSSYVRRRARANAAASADARMISTAGSGSPNTTTTSDDDEERSEIYTHFEDVDADAASEAAYDDFVRKFVDGTCQGRMSFPCSPAAVLPACQAGIEQQLDLFSHCRQPLAFLSFFQEAHHHRDGVVGVEVLPAGAYVVPVFCEYCGASQTALCDSARCIRPKLYFQKKRPPFCKPDPTVWDPKTDHYIPPPPKPTKEEEEEAEQKDKNAKTKRKGWMTGLFGGKPS